MSQPSSEASSEPRTVLEQSLIQSMIQPARAFFVPGTPRAPAARAAMADLPNPLFGQPVVPSVAANRPVFCQCDRRAGERCAFCWAWEPSDTHSIPTVWSAATSFQTSSISSATKQHGVWSVGQRLLWLEPERVSSGTFVIAFKKEIPQEMWQGLKIQLNGSIQLDPSGVRKGKKIAVKLPEDITPGDYDVTVAFGSTCVPGVLALEVTEPRADTGGA